MSIPVSLSPELIISSSAAEIAFWGINYCILTCFCTEIPNIGSWNHIPHNNLFAPGNHAWG